jgi:glycogen debranching enzyme
MPLVQENSFLGLPADDAPVPSFAAVRERLPKPYWEGHEDVVACYWKAWEIGFGNLFVPAKESRFVSPFIDTAFNGCLFMWDSAFALMFARYGARAFDFQRTLDNFYAHQHKDGYICREIRESDSWERFEKFDPSSTGPNVMPWCEWESYGNTGNRERLARVFPVLLAYTRWFSRNRTWQDGSFWSSGWGCGMDNQPRLPAGYAEAFEHGHMSWIDTTCQQVMANRILVEMAKVLGREADVADRNEETRLLCAHLNQRMWNGRQAFYVDRFRDGSLSEVKSIGSYWALLADVVPAERLEAFVGHLSDPKQFKRPHRVPTLSADDPGYDPEGGYWRGAVWAPTTYMVLRGLTHVGQHDLAHEIALNHIGNVTAAFVKQGTLFENYAPETAKGTGKHDFVGWTGLPPITVLFEYAFGLRPHAGEQRLLWDLRLTEAHGVDAYPFAAGDTIDLHCARRDDPRSAPEIRVTASCDLQLDLQWPGGSRTVALRAGACFTSAS